MMKIKSNYEEFKTAMTNEHSKRINAIMHTCDDEEFAVLFFKALEYVKPKLQRSEVISDEDKSLNVKIEIVKPKATNNEDNNGLGII